MLLFALAHPLPYAQLMRQPHLHPPQHPRRRVNPNRRIVPQPCPRSPQRLHKPHVLQRIHRRHTTHPLVHLRRTRQRCPEMLQVPRPRIAFLRIKKILQRRYQPLISPVSEVRPPDSRRQLLQLILLQHDRSTHRVCSGLEGRQVSRHPIPGHRRIRIRRQNPPHAPTHPQPAPSRIHQHSPRRSHKRLYPRQCSLRNTKPELRMAAPPLRHRRRRSVRTVVQQQQNLKTPRRQKLPAQIHLCRQCIQRRRQRSFFVPRRHNHHRSAPRFRTPQDQRFPSLKTQLASPFRADSLHASFAQSRSRPPYRVQNPAIASLVSVSIWES